MQIIHPTARKGIISSGYMPANRPTHYGIDFAGLPVGTPIYAWRSGTVEIASSGCVEGDLNCGGQAGNYVQIRHDTKTQSQYLHLVRVAVKRGQAVKAGQVIGYLGNTGFSTGAHLHFAILVNGSFVNPTPYIADAKKKSESENDIILPLLLLLLL